MPQAVFFDLIGCAARVWMIFTLTSTGRQGARRYPPPPLCAIHPPDLQACPEQKPPFERCCALLVVDAYSVCCALLHPLCVLLFYITFQLCTNYGWYTFGIHCAGRFRGVSYVRLDFI